MVLVIDNYDSFTYNLVQYIGELGFEPHVVRNDEITADGLAALEPTHVVISPGPGGPADAGISSDAIAWFADRVPVLGVCLGHQCIAHVFGGKVVRAPRLLHGKSSQVYHHGTGLFRGLGNPMPAARYHSLIVEEQSLPESLEITAYTTEGEIMAVQKRDCPVFGVQFHPESILTDSGKQLLTNFLSQR
jgi:anthranilate synthase/aminodeoxychorismate synthase-like glutamine amidotransferase